MLEGDAGLVGGQAQRQLVGTLDVGLVLAGTGEGGPEFASDLVGALLGGLGQVGHDPASAS
jgi:hypothetical protein